MKLKRLELKQLRSPRITDSHLLRKEYHCHERNNTVTNADNEKDTCQVFRPIQAVKTEENWNTFKEYVDQDWFGLVPVTDKRDCQTLSSYRSFEEFRGTEKTSCKFKDSTIQENDENSCVLDASSQTMNFVSKTRNKEKAAYMVLPG